MDEQAEQALDPMEQAMALIANSPDESDPPEEEQEAKPADDDAEEAPGGDDAPEEKPASEEPRKVKVTVKDEEGNDLEEEVTEDELKAGYQRQRDYTRKTQALSEREREAAQVFTSKLEETRTQYVTQLQQTYQALNAVAGLRSDDDMAVLAQTDPGAWVAEQQRQQQVRGVQAAISQQIMAQAEEAQRERNAQIEAVKQKTWQRLKEEGIDRNQLAGLFEAAKKSYSFITDERLGNTLDWESVLILKDALAYRKLKEQKPLVTKQVKEAPKLPESKAAPTKHERAQTEAKRAFKRPGGGSLKDLAAFINANQR